MAYAGGKGGPGVYQKIINLMPPHEVYIEPFVGGGAIMRLKRPARLNIGLDLSGQALKLLAPAFSASGSNLVPSPNADGLASAVTKIAYLAHFLAP